jgi:hypothetical protein
VSGPQLRWWRLSGYEALVAAALLVWTLAPLVILFVPPPGGESIASGKGTFTGSAGLVLGDHLQYLAWVRDAGEHVLFSNRYQVTEDPHLFLHPMWALSGLAWKLGASLPVAFIGWRPVGLVILFAGFAAYVRRLVQNGWPERATVLVLALFFVTPTLWLAYWFGIEAGELGGTLIVGFELFPAQFLWDSVPSAIAVGLLPLFLIGLERILDPRRRRAGRSGRWYTGWTAAAGLFASWLHPWQGLTLLAIVGGLLAWARFRPRHLAGAAIPLAATALPLAYYWALTRTDSSWQVVSQTSYGSHLGWWLFLSLAPLVLLALPGIAQRPRDIQERALLLWPPAALVVYFALQTSFFYHALAGLSLPLLVLAARGWRRLRPPRLVVVVVVAALIAPGVASLLDFFHDKAPDHFLTPGESAAFEHLERGGRPGAVLATVELGYSLPAFADRNVWVGHDTWTPDWASRRALAADLFGGNLSASDARALIRRSGVRYVLSDCAHAQTDLRPLLGDLVVGARRFGCAALYEVRKGDAANLD